MCAVLTVTHKCYYSFTVPDQPCKIVVANFIEERQVCTFGHEADLIKCSQINGKECMSET